MQSYVHLNIEMNCLYVFMHRHKIILNHHHEFCINSLTISYPYNPEIVKTEKRITLLGVAETCRFTADIRTAARTISAGTAAIL